MIHTPTGTPYTIIADVCVDTQTYRQMDTMSNRMLWWDARSTCFGLFPPPGVPLGTDLAALW